MDFTISLNLDEGFLRRECPSCHRQFKWHHGPTESRPPDAIDPPLYHCPYCGMTADEDEWWTDEQATYIERAMEGPVARVLNDELGAMFKGLNSKSITTSFSGFAEPETPGPPVEPDDMGGVEPPCHPWEPIKVAEDWVEPIHCIVCGELFRV